MWTLESKKIEHDLVDLSDPNRAAERTLFMSLRKPGVRQAPPLPQIFQDDQCIGVSVRKILSFFKSVFSRNENKLLYSVDQQKGNH